MSLFKGVKFLLVDDEPMISEILADCFKVEGAEVILAASGNEALELLGKIKFDVLISDVRMPNGDGRFLLQNLPSEQKRHLKIFLCSGFNDMTGEELKNLGVIAMFGKPFDLEKVMVVISKAISAK